MARSCAGIATRDRNRDLCVMEQVGSETLVDHVCTLWMLKSYNAAHS